jgi:hypothetical protein
LHMGIFHQPPNCWFFDSLMKSLSHMVEGWLSIFR